ncbi:histidine phosphatase family protein [Mucilaginibacter litoreus]|uniref:Histidine phosphatase family protein n=1 Tax=Mucilaginibacter litoreus TaxID=1048221 RepID=A0ABW3AWL2_9SPHI
MKIVLKSANFFKLTLFCLLISNYDALAQKTTIYLIRHAETEVTLPPPQDPVLSTAGQKRAEAIVKELKGKHIKAIYITSFKRSGLTAKPLAYKLKLLPRIYASDSLGLKQFAKSILKNFQGSNVLVVGHSNTLMPLLNYLGVNAPFAALSEQDYDMLFTVTVKDNQLPKLDIAYYGDQHHENQIPDIYLPEINHPETVRPFY